jgi:hypothetical protein
MRGIRCQRAFSREVRVKKTAILIAALAGVLLASHAQAQQPGQTYFGIGYGEVWTDGASPFDNTVDDDSEAGAKIYAGRMWERFGLEVGFYYLGKYDVSFGGAQIAETQTTATAVSGVMAIPLGGGLSFHAKLGLAFTYHEIECPGVCVALSPQLANTTKRGISGLLGVGLGAQLGESVLVRVDYEHIGNVHHAVGAFEYRDAYDMLSVNLQFNF